MITIINRHIFHQYRFNEHCLKLYKTKLLIKKRYLCTNNQFTIIYTDGACRKNGKLGSQGGIGVYFGENDIRNISEKLPGPIQTNQRAELYSVLRALEIVDKRENIEIRSDSIYLVKGMNEWSKDWIKSGWKKDIKNKDLFQQLCELTSNREGQTKFVHVKGHNGELGNMKADQLAVEGSLISVKEEKEENIDELFKVV